MLFCLSINGTFLAKTLQKRHIYCKNAVFSHIRAHVLVTSLFDVLTHIEKGVILTTKSNTIFINEIINLYAIITTLNTKGIYL